MHVPVAIARTGLPSKGQQGLLPFGNLPRNTREENSALKLKFIISTKRANPGHGMAPRDRFLRRSHAQMRCKGAAPFDAMCHSATSGVV